MIYYKLGGTGSTPLSVSALFTGRTAGDLNQTFDAALNNSFQVTPGSGISAKTFLDLGEQGTWARSDDLENYDGVRVWGLTCCAAVMFYEDINGGQPELFTAYHAPGGYIEEGDISNIDKDSVTYVVYATPILNTEKIEKYKNSVEVLANKFGTDKICLIDGFNRGEVFTDKAGGFVCF